MQIKRRAIDLKIIIESIYLRFIHAELPNVNNYFL